ncbi:MAG TPA: restriction endonuclease [Candidatus Angelobacter sp.]|jgi:hypothetical protein
MSRKRRPVKTKNPRKAALEKGNSLERAVGAIESAILQTEPSAKGKTFTLEFKKIIIVNYVRHEIDVYVTVHFAPGYVSVFIFECKNWAEPIGKNEIIIFSEKVKTIGASHGYFVGTNFTKDAIAQAKTDNRLTLLKATEHDPLQLSSLKAYAVGQKYLSYGATVWAKDGSQLVLNDVSHQFPYQGTMTTLEQLLRDSIRKESKERLRDFASDKAAGTYDFDLEFVRHFSPGELEILGKDVEKINITAKTTVEVIPQPVISSFDIESRGRVISYAPINMPQGGVFQAQTILVYANEKKK